MKLPFEFANKLILRLLAPGALTAAIPWPLISKLLEEMLGGKVQPSVAFPLSALFFGWLVMALDMPIYMLAEGRRYWPRWLFGLLHKRQERRLLNLQAELFGEVDPRRRKELDVLIGQYPSDKQGKHYASFPTRFGNLVYSSEEYSYIKYGVDGIFAWSRIWVLLDKDLRMEIDDRQAVVDGSLYCAVLSLILSPVLLGYFIADLAPVASSYLSLPADGWLFLAAIPALLLFSALLWKAAIYNQAQYGEIFCAVFDTSLAKWDFSKLLQDLSQHTGANIAGETDRERARAAIRFLKFHKFRKQIEAPNETVLDWTK